MRDSFRAGGRSFRADFSSEGEKLLKREVKAKLEDFMGYEDDVLADYIIVLVKNGKREEVAEEDLHVFLGEDSSSFVSWLWDHLSSNLHLYVKPQESSLQDKAAPSRSLVVDCAKGNVSQSAYKNVSSSVESEHLQETALKEAGGCRKRRWEGPTRDESEPLPLRTSELDDYFPKDSAQSASSNAKKGHYHQEEQTMVEHNQQIDQKTSKRSFKSELKVDAPHRLLQSAKSVKSEPKVDAPRRLLQFAVREALGPLRSKDSSRSESALKRLQSVVSSTTCGTSIAGFSQCNVNRPVSKVSVTTAMRAAAEVAYDTSTARPTRNVINRMDINSRKEGYEERLGSPRTVELGSGNDRNLQREFYSPLYRRGQPGNFKLNEYNSETQAPLTNFDRNMETYSSFASGNDVYDDDDEGQGVMEVNQTSYSGNNDNKSLMMEYSLTQSDEVLRTDRLKEQSSAVTAKPTHKIVNISVNVNTWKPPHFQSSIDVPKVEEQTGLQDRGAFACKTRAQLMHDKDRTVAINRVQEMPNNDSRKKEVIVSSVPGSHSTIRSSDDVESRIIYVSNVHFGATKDSLSTHFNRCGEVQKVVIVMDAATGQPTGSAYVEFVRKESAELALSLNGTSFMSRILKIVPKSSVSQEATRVMPWSGFHRPNPYSFRPIPGIPFARGMPGIYARPPHLKVGPRSLQWKRDSPSSVNAASNNQIGSAAGTQVSVTPLSATARRALTYIRSGSKPASRNSFTA